MSLKQLSFCLVFFIGFFSSAVLADEESQVSLVASDEVLKVQAENTEEADKAPSSLKSLKESLALNLKNKETLVDIPLAPQEAEGEKEVKEEGIKEEPMEQSLPFVKKGMYALTKAEASFQKENGEVINLPKHKIVALLKKTETGFLAEYNGMKGYLDKFSLKAYTPEAVGKVVNPVPYISQLYPVYAPNGCEPTSMLMGLKAKGYTNIDLKTYLDKMPKHPSNPKIAYVGLPYNTEYHRFQTIDPEPLAAYGRTYGANTESLRGKPIESVIREVQNGNTVVLWATLYWQGPSFSTLKIDGIPTRRIFNNHVLLVTGYDPAKKAFYIADPYNHESLGVSRKKPYYYWKPLSVVNQAYNYDNRRFAVAVR